MKPVEGASKEGEGGFFKGVGKGVAGLVTRPTGGIIDFASGTFDSVKRVTEVSEDLNRVRPARWEGRSVQQFVQLVQTFVQCTKLCT